MPRRIAPLVAAALVAVGLAGCAGVTSPDAQGVSTTVPATGEWVGASVDVRFADGSARLCRFDPDPGFSIGLSPCDEELVVAGITPDQLRADLLAQGSTVRAEDGVDVIPAFVVGTIAGRTFQLESIDHERYAPPAPPPPTTPAPGFATGEEKDAWASAQPVPQPEGCTAPSGGWRSMAGLGLGAAGDYQRAHPDVVLGNGQTFVDHSTQIALVAVAADADPESVASDLAGAYPDALCVRRSAFTAADLDRVVDDPVLRASETVLSSSLRQPSESFSDDPEPVFTVVVTRLTDDVVDRAAEYPDGLVELRPWFEPVG